MSLHQSLIPISQNIPANRKEPKWSLYGETFYGRNTVLIDHCIWLMYFNESSSNSYFGNEGGAM